MLGNCELPTRRPVVGVVGGGLPYPLDCYWGTMWGHDVRVPCWGTMWGTMWGHDVGVPCWDTMWGTMLKHDRLPQKLRHLVGLMHPAPELFCLTYYKYIESNSILIWLKSRSILLVKEIYILGILIYWFSSVDVSVCCLTVEGAIFRSRMDNC